MFLLLAMLGINPAISIPCFRGYLQLAASRPGSLSFRAYSPSCFVFDDIKLTCHRQYIDPSGRSLGFRISHEREGSQSLKS